MLLPLACAGDTALDEVSDTPDSPAPMTTPVSVPAALTPAASGGSAGTQSALAREVSEASLMASALRGGRLYDRFYGENAELGFTPDSADTAAADGKGGPDGNGTLPDGEGRVLDNQSGHGYRMKNFFGWDLRGAEGIYGQQYHDEPYVVSVNLIDDPLSRLELAALFTDGAANLPAWGKLLPVRDLADLVSFVMAVRARALPQPGDIWELDPDAPEGYVLRPGANVAAGDAAIAVQCGNSACHGADGTARLFDDGEYSLGSYARQNAYEAWFKIVVGNVGSPMQSQLSANLSAPERAQFVLNVLAALCDQRKYPLGAASEEDVPGGDLRCGSYLR